MASNSHTDDPEVPDVESFAPARPRDDGSSRTGKIDLDAGERLTGRITEYDPSVGDHGLIEIDGRTLWLNASMKEDLIESLVEGEPVLHEKGEEEKTFEDDSGQTRTYFDRFLRFQRRADTEDN
jgi:hypothetical protein